MKVRKFEVLTGAVRLTPYRGDAIAVPFARMRPRPTRNNPIVDIGWDPDIGRHGVAYTLADGAEGAVLWDHALSVANDPTYVARMREHVIRVRLLQALDQAAAGMSVRELAQQLGTSVSQVQRLRSPSAKLDALIRALVTLGCEVQVNVHDAA